MRHLKLAFAGLFASLSVAVPSAHATSILSDSGFESQGLTTNNYCYFGFASAGNPACGSGAWTGGNTANFGGGGLQFESNGAWPGQPSPDGTRYGFVQMTGSLSQVFTPSQTGDYLLTWIDAGRPAGCCGGNQSYQVFIDDGSSLSPVLYDGTTTTSQPWTARTADFSINLRAGTSYTLTFQGLESVTDQTSFIDAVSLDLAPLSAVPEPASWALMIAGFGLVGASMRRRAGAVLARA
jgi:PEP-CTERM motif